MTETKKDTEVRETLSAPTLLETAQEARRKRGEDQITTHKKMEVQDVTETVHEGGQIKTRELNPFNTEQSAGGQKIDRRVQQAGGTPSAEEVESARKASSFLGKRLFGERFSSKVDDQGRPIEGDKSKAKTVTNGKPKGEGDQPPKAPVITKTPKQPAISADVIATTIRSTVEAVLGATAKGKTAEAVEEFDPSKLPPKERQRFTIVQHMAESMPDQYKELPNQYVSYSKKKTEYKKKWESEHEGETFNWDDEEHQGWVDENEPKFDPDDFDEARIRLAAREAAKPELEKANNRIAELEAQTAGTQIRDSVVSHSKSAVKSFQKSFVPDREWDLTTDAGRQKAMKEDRILGPIAAKYANRSQIAMTELIKLYDTKSSDGKQIYRLDTKNPVHNYLVDLANEWERILSERPADETVNKAGQTFVTRAEWAKLSESKRKEHWTLMRDEMIQVLRQDMLLSAETEKQAKLEELESIAKSQGWNWNPESVSARRPPKTEHHDGIDETPVKTDDDAASDESPSSGSGTRIDTSGSPGSEDNTDFAKMLVGKLFKRHSESQ